MTAHVFSDHRDDETTSGTIHGVTTASYQNALTLGHIGESTFILVNEGSNNMQYRIRGYTVIGSAYPVTISNDLILGPGAQVTVPSGGVFARVTVDLIQVSLPVTFTLDYCGGV